MKISFQLFILLLFSLIIHPAFGQRMKGKIKSFRDSYYSVHEKFGKIQKGPKLNDSVFHDEYFSFDQNGNISQEVEYNSDGTVYCTFKGRYGYADNNIESIYVRFDPEITIETKPFILESVKYSWGEKYKMTYKNDTKGQPTEETIYDLFGRVLNKIKFKRDENGNLLEESFSDGTVYKYKYDEKGNRIEWTSISSNSNIIVASYQYDDLGNIIEMNLNNYFKSTYKFHYDNFTFKYIYDDQGNWIERTDYEYNKPKRIVVRTIEYSS
jgi:YD repeat-containing protein